jgi:glycosyltransferase involved in cell wall biosynthesis
VKALIVSKALIHAAYRRKLDELAALGVEVAAVVPPSWREGGAEQRLEAAGDHRYRLIVSPLRWNGHFHVHYYPRLPEVVRTVGPDLVHLDEEPYNLATYLGVRAAAGRPSLFFSWQNLERRYPPPFRYMERRVYRSVRGALAGSEAVVQVLRHKGFAKPAWVVPQFGVDPDEFTPSPRRHDGFTVGFLNRLTRGKAPLLALGAFARLPADSRLLIVGEGPLRGRLETEIANMRLSSRVSIRPRIPSVEMPGLIQSLDAVILPSISTPRWKEQFGRVLIESMACGVPVVGSDSGEIPGVIGDAGLIVPEGDGPALADALRRLYDDPGLREDLAVRGRRRVLERFSHARIAEATRDAYRAVLEEAG